MASIGPLRIPVRLSVGDVEAEIGTLEIDVLTAAVPGEPFAVSVGLRKGDLMPQLATLLRAAAGKFEQGVTDATPHD